MNQLEKEKLKDILIDYSYDYLYNQKFKVLRCPGMFVKNEIYPVDLRMKGGFRGFHELEIEYFKNSEGSKYIGYETNNKEYYRFSNRSTSFCDRFERLGMKRENVPKVEIDNAIQYLCDKSYIARDQPSHLHLKLTPKGIFHYENGLSFENTYLANSAVKKANKISKISICISIFAIVMSLFIQSLLPGGFFTKP